MPPGVSAGTLCELERGFESKMAEEKGNPRPPSCKPSGSSLCPSHSYECGREWVWLGADADRWVSRLSLLHATLCSNLLFNPAILAQVGGERMGRVSR